MIAVNTAELVVTVRLTNADVLADNSTAGTGHICMLLIGDDDNNIVYKAKVRSRCSGCC